MEAPLPLIVGGKPEMHGRMGEWERGGTKFPPLPDRASSSRRYDAIALVPPWASPISQSPSRGLPRHDLHNPGDHALHPTVGVEGVMGRLVGGPPGGQHLLDAGALLGPRERRARVVFQ